MSIKLPSKPKGIVQFQDAKIKIDVDGNEELVFSGGMKTILSAQEIYLEDNGLDSDAEIVQTLLDNGFSISKQLPCFVGGVESDVSRNILLTRPRIWSVCPT